ncbi:MAG: serine/threonine protein kinase [Verrucomicrobiales bacterium]|nr:serine/threonine protein kinase [Verrucomicrobiales bacterium]
MNARLTCPKCGNLLPADAPHGICPDCLLELLAPETEEQRLPSAQNTEKAQPLGKWKRFGDYELLEEIARGGMGVVYKARQLSLNRIVAVKLILAGQFAGKHVAQRFRAEAAAAAILQHPNIVAVHDVGVQDDQHFFSMDYVQGQNLAQLVGNRPLPPQKAAGYVKLIAEAIHYAHGQGILHRDLKPSNVLIDATTDQPRITDFGLAKRLVGTRSTASHSSSGEEIRDAVERVPTDSLTLTGQVLGSPNFMPPEQAGGNRGKAGRHSDVYSLGGMLYYLLTARAPFQADSLETIVTQVLNADPVAPRLLNPTAPRDLETICLKCLEKDPAQRYPTAQALAEELERFLNGHPVRARPLGRVGKLWRWCQRHPALAIILVLLQVVLGLGVAGITWQWRRATLGEATARRNLYAADMLLAQQAIESSSYGRAVELLQRWRVAASNADDDFRGWEWHYLWRQCRSDERTTLGTHKNPVTALAFAPGGARLASASIDGQMRLWDLDAEKLIATLGHVSGVNTLAFSSDGQWLATGGHNSGVRLWRADTLTEQPLESAPSQVMTVHFAGDGRLLAGGLEELTAWTLPPLAKPVRTPFDGGWKNAFSPDAQWAACGRLRGNVILLNLAAEGDSFVLSGHAGGVFGLAFSRDGRWLASSSADETARIWEVQTQHEIAVLRGHRSSLNGVAFSPDGHLLATTSNDQTVKLWNTATWREHATLRGHLNRVQSVAFSPDGRCLASGDFNGDVKLWTTLPKPAETNRLIYLPAAKIMMTSPDLSTIGGFTDGGHFLEWNLLSESAPPRELFLERGRIVLASCGGRLRALELGDGVIQLFDSSWNETVRLQGTHAPVRTGSFTRDGEKLAVARTTAVIEFWDVRRGGLLEQQVRHPAQISAGLCFSPDGLWVVAGYNDGMIELWQGHRTHRATRWLAHPIQVTGVAFSPNNEILATAGRDSVVRLWKLPNLELVTTLKGSTADMQALAFSTDGRRLAVGTYEGQVTLWDLSIQREVLRLGGHLDPMVFAVAFTPDDKTLISASRRDVIFWRTESSK